jgi:hypothetical protein
MAGIHESGRVGCANLFDETVGPWIGGAILVGIAIAGVTEEVVAGIEGNKEDLSPVCR